MTSPGTRADADAEDLDVEEALALVRETPGHGSHDNGSHGSHGRRDSHGGHGAPAPHHPADAHHQTTPWPEARATAGWCG
ncbi:molybdopterin molybdenumtransferase MoeA, partial [Streptomyces sp. ME02-6977A]|nr:molybdopterin molybdenumtransferase MoeA [Streptomyces sp. ME02-6977A]